MRKEEALRHISEQQWVWGSAPGVYQFCLPFMVGFMRMRQHYQEYYHSVFLLFSEGLCSQLTPQEQAYKNIEQLYLHPQQTRRLRRRWLEDWKRFSSWCPAATSHLHELDDEALARRYQTFMERFFDLWAPTLSVDLMGTYTERTLLQEFLEAVPLPKSQAIEAYALLCQPSQQSFVAREHHALLRLTQEQGKPCFEESLKAHQEAFFWIENNYRHIKVLPTAYFRAKIHELQEEQLQELQEERRDIPELEEEQARRCAALGLSAALQEKLLLTRELTMWQDERREMQMRGNHFLNELLKEIAKRVRIDLEDLYFASYDEIRGLLKDEIAVRQEVLKERARHLVQVVEQPEQETLFEGSDADEIIAAFDTEQHGEQLQGLVANNAGKKTFEGVVSVVNDVAEDPFTAGHILVASMTRPEYVPLMKKAAAVITDEGGITSHAAIVSRELGLPCIIGTRHATKLLKNGSRVALDLTAGTITVVTGATTPQQPILRAARGSRSPSGCRRGASRQLPPHRSAGTRARGGRPRRREGRGSRRRA